MARVLIVYGTSEGHTAQIAERMASAIQGAGHAAELRDAKALRKRELPSDFDAIIIGGSVHMGELQGSVRDVARHNRELLERTPSALFSVSLAASQSDDESRAEDQAVIDKFVRDTGWTPPRVEHIAGALVYSHYNFFMRLMMKTIVKQHGRTELDTSRDYEFTDWPAVERFALDFVQEAVAA